MNRSDNAPVGLLASQLIARLSLDVITPECARMQVYLNLIDWNDAQRRHVAGTLATDIGNVDGTESWLVDVDWPTDSAAQHLAVGDTYKSIAPHLDVSNREHADATIGLLMGGYDQEEIDDLKAGLDSYFLVLSPGRVVELASKFDKVDYGMFPTLFEAHCPEDHRETLETYEVDFRGYIDLWHAAVRSAAQRQMGILGYMG